MSPWSHYSAASTVPRLRNSGHLLPSNELLSMLLLQIRDGWAGRYGGASMQQRWSHPPQNQCNRGHNAGFPWARKTKGILDQAWTLRYIILQLDALDNAHSMLGVDVLCAHMQSSTLLMRWDNKFRIRWPCVNINVSHIWYSCDLVLSTCGNKAFPIQVRDDRVIVYR